MDDDVRQAAAAARLPLSANCGNGPHDDTTREREPLLSLNNLSKSYGPTRALVDFSLEVSAGAVVSLVGENGAGKSTLARLLAGAQTPDRGTITLRGEAVHLPSPRAARRYGIGFIPQELAPVPTLSLAENLFLGDLPTVRGVASQRRIQAAASKELASLGIIDIDVAKKASSASLPELQLIDVAKAVRQRSSVVVFDEPTASLSETETQILHTIIRTMSSRGVAIVYISHRMDEVFAFSSRICVLRNGQKIAEHKTCDVSRETLVHEMVGRAVTQHTASPGAHTDGIEILNVSGCHRTLEPSLHGVSISLHEGEIIGLYGVRGSGAEALAAVLGGQLQADQGNFTVSGTRHPRLPRNPRIAKSLGIRYIPADRKKSGLALRLSVTDNISLPNYSAISRGGLISTRRQHNLVSQYVDSMNIALNSPAQRVEDLSGGNQQKVLLAGRLAQPGNALVLQEPTRGVDVGARADIHTILRQIADTGVGVILASTDVDEVVSLADTVIVMRDGKVAARLTGSAKTQANAVDAATQSENH